MKRSPVTESSKGLRRAPPPTLFTSKRNRLITWESTEQEFTKSGAVIPSSKIAIIPRPLGFVSKTTKSIFASLAKLPYALFKLCYAIAKLVTRGLSSIRRLLFVSK